MAAEATGAVPLPFGRRDRGRGQGIVAARIPANTLWNGAAALDIHIPRPFPFSGRRPFGRLTLDPAALRNTNFTPVAFDPNSNDTFSANNNNNNDAIVWDALIANAQEVVDLDAVYLDDARDDGDLDDNNDDDGDVWETGHVVQIRWYRFGFICCSMLVLAVGLVLVPAMSGGIYHHHHHPHPHPHSSFSGSRSPHSPPLRTRRPFFQLGSVLKPCPRPRQSASEEESSNSKNGSTFETPLPDPEVTTNASFVHDLSLNIHMAQSLSLDMVGHIAALYRLGNLMYDFPPVQNNTGQDEHATATTSSSRSNSSSGSVSGSSPTTTNVALAIWDSSIPIGGWTSSLFINYAASRREMCHSFFLPLLHEWGPESYEKNRDPSLYGGHWDIAYMYTWRSLKSGWLGGVLDDQQDDKVASEAGTTIHEIVAARQVYSMCSNHDPKEDGKPPVPGEPRPTRLLAEWLSRLHGWFLDEWKSTVDRYLQRYLGAGGDQDQLKELQSHCGRLTSDSGFFASDRLLGPAKKSGGQRVTTGMDDDQDEDEDWDEDEYEDWDKDEDEDEDENHCTVLHVVSWQEGNGSIIDRVYFVRSGLPPWQKLLSWAKRRLLLLLGPGHVRSSSSNGSSNNPPGIHDNGMSGGRGKSNSMVNKAREREIAHVLLRFAKRMEKMLTPHPWDGEDLQAQLQSYSDDLLSALQLQLQRDKLMMRSMEDAMAGPLWQRQAKKIRSKKQQQQQQWYEPWWLDMQKQLQRWMRRGDRQDEGDEVEEDAELVAMRVPFRIMYSQLELVAADTETLVNTHFAALADSLAQLQTGIIPKMSAAATALIEDASLRVSHEEARELVMGVAQILGRLNDEIAGLVLAHSQWVRETALRKARHWEEGLRRAERFREAVAKAKAEKLQKEEADSDEDHGGQGEAQEAGEDDQQ